MSPLLPLFPDLPALEEAESGESLSYTRRVTLRNNLALAAGRHPATGLRLREDETCGTCEHHVVRALAGTYHKCELAGLSGSVATDIRVSWPACTRWKASAAADSDV